MSPILLRPIPFGRRLKTSRALSAAPLLVALHTCAGCVSDPSPSRPAEPALVLHAPRAAGSMSLEEAVNGRRSVRELAREPLSVDEVGQLLWAAQGITDPASGHRASPSAGALYPLEVYALDADGVHHYLPEGHRIERVLQGDLRSSLADAALGQAAVEHSGLTLVLTGVVARTSAKYGERAQRYMFMEAGHAAENVLLQATAMGLGSVPIGAFSDEAVRALLALPDQEQPLYIIAVGKRRR